MNMDRYFKSTTRLKVEARFENPSYPTYYVTDDHGWVAATVDGSLFPAETVRKVVELLRDGRQIQTEPCPIEWHRDFYLQTRDG